MHFDPRFLFVALWGTQFVGHALAGGVFRPLECMTWMAMVLAVASFLVGAQARLAWGQHRSGDIDLARAPAIPVATEYERWITGAVPAALLAYALLAALTFYALVRALGATDVESFSVELLRQSLISDFTDEREVTGLLKVFFAGVGLSIYLQCFPRITKRMRLLIFAVGLVSAILTTGRLAVLLLFLATTYALYSLDLIRGRGIAIGVALFAAVFLGIALLVNKGADAGDSSAQVVWNVEVYLLGSVAAFNHFVAWGDPKIAGGALLPNALRQLIAPFTGAVPLKPPVNPFIDTPVTTNAYSALYPVYHDMGVAGIVVVFAILGAFHQTLYLRQREGGPTFRYAYALSLYPLAMTVFEEAYVSSPGFWLTLLAVPVVTGGIFRLSMIFKGGTVSREPSPPIDAGTGSTNGSAT